MNIKYLIPSLIFISNFSFASDILETWDQKIKFTTKSPLSLTSTCTSFINSLPQNLQYGWLYVPQDYQTPQGPMFHVFFYGHLNLALKNKITPILNTHGGPVGGSSSMYLRWLKTNFKTPKNHAMIFSDQRGNGCSSPYPVANNLSPEDFVPFAARSITKDYENFRKIYLNGKKIKITGRSYSHSIVNMMVEDYPGSIISAHVDAFTSLVKSSKYTFLKNTYYYSKLRDFFSTRPILQSQIVAKIKADISKNCPLDSALPCLYETFNAKEYESILDSSKWGSAEKEISNRLYGSISLGSNWIQFLNNNEYTPLDPVSKAAWSISIFDIATTEAQAHDPFGAESGHSKWLDFLRHEDSFYLLAWLNSSDFIYYEDPRYREHEEWKIQSSRFKGYRKLSLESVCKNLDNFDLPYYLSAGASDTLDPPSVFMPFYKVCHKVKFHIRPGNHIDTYLDSMFWKNLERH